MAQVGDTITYTPSDGSAVTEDVSSVDKAVIDYCYGGGGENGDRTEGAAGGSVTNVTVDVSAVNILYIWVAADINSTTVDGGKGRFDGADGSVPYLGSGDGAGSTEIAFPSQVTGNSDAPAVCGAGGGAGGGGAFSSTGGGGARGGTSIDYGTGNGTAPPQGGDGKISPTAGDGYINSALSEVSGGSTTLGGGSSGGTNGEVQISYKASLSPPDPPSNLTAEVQ